MSEETSSSSNPTSPVADSPTLTDPQSPTRGGTIPTLKSIQGNSTTSSTHALGAVNAARRPLAPHPPSSPQIATASSFSAGNLPKDVQERLRQFQASRASPQTPGGGAAGGFMAPKLNRPQAQGWPSAPSVMNAKPKTSLGARRGLALGGLPGNTPGSPGSSPVSATTPVKKNKGPGPLPNGTADNKPVDNGGSLFSKYSDIVDTATGTLNFKDKAIINKEGIQFASGSSFKINLDEVQSLDELGKGNYGTVYKVIHRKPKMRLPGAGVADREQGFDPNEDGNTGIVMAMKEIRLELDEAKFTAIIMELDILHRCISPFVIDFYGAFFQEGAVYICIEYMDGGSMDKLYGDGVPEDVLKRVTWATVKGLRCLKDEHNIIHRDVKPTNILVNTRGEVKLCDFGVSGNLVASIAKTNIGCQSYMAPERIASGGMAAAGGGGGGTYSVQSDIWSLGLSILECAMGRYPYPPETYNNIFSQLSAIVDGAPPDLPEEGFSSNARDFVRQTLNKTPALRPSYANLLRHPWFAEFEQFDTISEEDEDAAAQSSHTFNSGANTKGYKEVGDWVKAQMDKRKKKIDSGGKWGSEKPALHSVALDKVSSPTKSPDGVLSEAAGGLAI